MTKAHVLHVDDDPDIRLLIAASLQDFGYVVATAGTKAEALELARQWKFDLSILDVRLPDGTGIELCQEILHLQPKIPVLYYSAYASDAEQEAAVVRDIGVAVDHTLLHFDGPAHRFDRAGKLNQKAITGGFDDPAVVQGNEGLD